MDFHEIFLGLGTYLTRLPHALLTHKLYTLTSSLPLPGQVHWIAIWSLSWGPE